MKLEVFDPAMCCSTGVCGDSADPALATFADDLEWVASAGGSVRRYNFGQEPGAFAERDEVRALLHESGEDALPIVVVGGTVRSAGRYPGRDELAAWAGLDTAATSSPLAALSTELIVELAAIGAAVGANCEPCFKYHYDAARKLGLSNEQITLAVRTAQFVKEVPAGKMVNLAAKLLRVDTSAIAPTAAASPAADGSCSGLPGSGEDPANAPTEKVVAEGECCGSAAKDEPSLPIRIGAVPASTSSCC